jgi:hypothetical protein
LTTVLKLSINPLLVRNLLATISLSFSDGEKNPYSINTPRLALSSTLKTRIFSAPFDETIKQSL